MAGRFPSRVATELQRRDGIDRLTYGELAALAGRAAGWLTAHGVAPGDRVAMLAENDGTWCGAYLGVLRAGAVAVPLDTNYAAEQIARLLADCDAAAVVTSARFEPLARMAMDRGRCLPHADMHRAFDDCPEQPPVPVGPDAAAVILYTSGTTADPKGVVLTHRNIMAERSSAFQRVQVDERDTVLSVLPLFHALAQMANLLLPFSVGARVVFLETLNTAELTRALRERGITAFVCVPQFFYLLHQRIDAGIHALPWPARVLVRALARMNLRIRRGFRLNPGKAFFRTIHRSLGPHLRLLVTGGARFDPAINEALFALGFSIRQAYGLTECSGAATVSAEGDPFLESVGRVLPGNELRIAESHGTGGDGDGEVLIRGPIVMQGYFNRSDQNAVTLEDGWLHTGDLGRLDSDGRLFITGRSKDVIVLGSGKNIHPEEIETHYERSPFIAELCVLGVSRPGEPTTERLHAVVRPDADALRARGIVNMRELVRFELEGLSVQLPAHKRILGFEITLDPLPRTTTRKLKRFEIQQRLEARADRRAHVDPAAATAWPEDRATQRIVSLIREQVTRDVPLTPSAHLELDLGLDSMERVELFVHVTGTLGLAIPEEETQRLHTVGELVEACRARLGEGWEAAGRVQAWERLLDEPPADALLDELKKPKRIRAALLFVALKLLSAFLRAGAGLRARGKVNLPAHGPFIISPNHQSYVDPFLLVGALPFRAFREMFFVGAAEYFQTPLTGWLARAINVIPIDPDANLVAAMQAGAHGLRLGKVLVLFPEGERSIDGTVKEFRKGAAILSQHTGAPIVPVAIDGAWDLWARGRSIDWRAWLPGSGTRVRLEFGPPLPAPAHGDYGLHTDLLRETVEAMWQRLHRERAVG